MEILKSIADNPALMEALRKVLLKQFDLSSIRLNESDARMGEDVRAILGGIQRIEDAFKEIETYKTIKTEKDEEHPAR